MEITELSNLCDTHPSWTALDGRPLHGFLEFVEQGTSDTYVNVFDTDGNNIGHIVTTNESGFAYTQVMVHGDCDIRLFRFVGTTFDVTDPTQFELDHTIRYNDPSLMKTITIGGETALNTMQELREFSDAADRMVVRLNGYYEGGDSTPRNYYFDATSELDDDGGSVIQPDGITGAGRWILNTGDSVDVTWFGVRPSLLLGQVTYQSSAMLAAIEFAMSFGKPLYFPAYGAATFYGVDNVDMDIGESDVRMDSGVRLVAKSDTSNVLTCRTLSCSRDASVFVGQGRWEVHAEVLYSSSVRDVYDYTCKTLHYNYAAANKQQFSDMTIVWEVAPGMGANFTNCKFEFVDGVKLAVSNNFDFYGMQWTDRWYPAGFDVRASNDTVHDDCTLDIEDFANPLNWFYVKANHFGLSSIDCEGTPMGDVVMEGNMVVSNASFTSITTTYDLSIIRGQVLNLYASGNRTIALSSTYIAGTSSNIACSDIEMDDCYIGGGFLNVSNDLSANESEINSTTTVAGRMLCTGCKLGAFSAADYIRLERCVLTSALSYQAFLGAEITSIVNDCTFENGCSLHVLRSGNSDITGARFVHASWVGNTSSGNSDWLVLDRTFLDPDDSNHVYEFSGNHGGAQPYGVTDLGVRVYDSNTSASGPTDKLVVTQPGERGTFIGVSGNPLHFDLFTVGTTNVKVLLDIEFLGIPVIWDGWDPMSGQVVRHVLENSSEPCTHPVSIRLSDTDLVRYMKFESLTTGHALVHDAVNPWRWNIVTQLEDGKTLDSPDIVNMWEVAQLHANRLFSNTYGGADGRVRITAERLHG